MQDDNKAADWYRPRRRSRRPRGDVRARDAAHRRPRRRRSIARRPPSCSPPPRGSSIRSRPTISRCSISKASCSRGFRARRAAVPRRRRRRQPGGAIRARHALQGRPRRAARTSSKPRGCSLARRSPTTPTPRSSMAIALFNGTGVAKNEQDARALPAARGAQGQPDRAEPPRPHPGGRPRPARRSGRGDQVASDLQGRRRQRPEARRLHAAAEAGHHRRRREGGASLDRGASGSPASRGLDAAARGGQTHALQCSTPPSSTS